VSEPGVRSGVISERHGAERVIASVRVVQRVKIEEADIIWSSRRSLISSSDAGSEQKLATISFRDDIIPLQCGQVPFGDLTMYFVVGRFIDCSLWIFFPDTPQQSSSSLKFSIVLWCHASSTIHREE